MQKYHSLSRRDFIKLSALSVGGLFLKRPFLYPTEPIFPETKYLGRVNVGKVDITLRPDNDSPIVGALYEDAVIPWVREVVGSNPYRVNQNYIETPDGFIWSPYIQPVRNIRNNPVLELPDTSNGKGMWAEVTVPYLDLFLENPPARSPWLKDSLFPRLYFSQVLWIDRIKQIDDGRILYRINEKFGYGDIFWAAAEGFRPLTEAELTPISPDVDNKHIVVDVNYQTIACYEANTEVFFARVSTGAKFNSSGDAVDKWATPVGSHPIWRKLISLHMSGGTTGGGYDLPGIAWTTLFVGSGIAIHATYWHSDYGVPRSHGCVNARAEDAKWIFRWTNPKVSLDPGDITVQMPGGTIVQVVEG